MTHEELLLRENSALRLQLEAANEKVAAVQREQALQRIAAREAGERAPIILAQQQKAAAVKENREKARRGLWTNHVVDSAFRDNVLPLAEIVDPKRIEEGVAAAMSAEDQWPPGCNVESFSYLRVEPDAEPEGIAAQPISDVGRRLADAVKQS